MTAPDGGGNIAVTCTIASRVTTLSVNGDIIKRQVEVHGRNRVASFVVRRLFDGETASDIVDVAP